MYGSIGEKEIIYRSIRSTRSGKMQINRAFIMEVTFITILVRLDLYIL